MHNKYEGMHNRECHSTTCPQHKDDEDCIAFCDGNCPVAIRIQLLSCAYCGNNLNVGYMPDEIIEKVQDSASKDTKYRVFCLICGVSGPWSWTIKEAKLNWNQRKK